MLPKSAVRIAMSSAVAALVLLAACTAPAPRKPAASSAPPVAAAAAAETNPLAVCLERSRFEVMQVMPAPPAAGSVAERAELDEMLQVQAARTTAQADRARADAEISVSRFSEALGDAPAFDVKQLPLTQALFRAVTADEGMLIESAKQHYARPRPYVTEPQLKPVVAKPASAAYPSGHSTWSTAVGYVLADMVPERRDALVARAEEYAHNRVVGGVHYPSDIVAGRLAGVSLATLLFSCPEFRAQERPAAAELRRASRLPATP